MKLSATQKLMLAAFAGAVAQGVAKMAEDPDHLFSGQAWLQLLVSAVSTVIAFKLESPKPD